MKLKKIYCVCLVAIMATMSTMAQKIEVVDNEGYGIPLVSVLNEDGTLIGTTDLNGVVGDVKGATKVTLTHVAYKPQQVTVASLANGRITMEDLDYNLEEIVVKPKPYIYVETYYRFYAFINDSLRYYQAGILPNIYDLQKKKVDTGSHDNSMGYYGVNFGASITWGARVSEYNAGKIHTSIAKKMEPGGEISEDYFFTLVDEGNGRRRIDNPEGTVGYIITEGDQISLTFDAGKAQMYRNKKLGQDKTLKRREKADYAYQKTEIFKMDEDGNCTIENFIMNTDHWEWNKGKGRHKMIIETYSTDRSYIDKKEWSEKKKELKEDYKALMTLNQLEAYAAAHNIPALAPTVRQAIERINKN